MRASNELCHLAWTRDPLVDTSGEGSRQAEEGGLLGLVGHGVS